MMPENSHSDADAKHKSGWTGTGMTLLVILLLYVGSYYAVLILPWRWRLPTPEPPLPEGLLEAQGSILLPDYHGVPGWFFYPIHQADLKLRPNRWSAPVGSHPEHVRWNSGAGTTKP